MNITEFLDWPTLATFAGASVVTGIFTQILKGIFDKAPFHLPTRLLSYVIALIVLLSATFFNGGAGVSDYAICFINGAFVSLSSNGTFDLFKSMARSESKEEEEDKDENNT